MAARARAGAVSALDTWLDGPAAARFRRRRLARAPVILPPRDGAWRRIAPAFAECVAMLGAGLPFQIAADRGYDRSADPGRLRPALRAGKSVFLPQAHQVLPRLARLVVALRASLLGPGREECSFLFLAEGRGREGMGLHHDGEVDAFWLQLEGRRTVTIGAQVPRGTPEELPDDFLRQRPAGRAVTLDLPPGTLFYLPPRTPHRVVYHGRSLAVSLTWGRTSAGRPRPDGLAGWDVVDGHADRVPPRGRRLWTQVPAAPAAPAGRRRELSLVLPGGAVSRVPLSVAPHARRLATMPSWPATARWRSRLAPLIERGIVADRDLPLRIVPARPRALDGWRFA